MDIQEEGENPMSSDPSRHPMEEEAVPGPTGLPAGAPAAERRRRGRPLEMSQDELVARIQRLSKRKEGLFRVHRTHSGLYARARRQFGSWSAAVRAAGLDYDQAVQQARGRSLKTRRVRLLRRVRPVS